MEFPLAPQLKFKRIEADIRDLVKTLPVGTKLPSERKIAESQNCNFLTVRRALKSLVDDGLIVRQVGSGTFVADLNSPRPAVAHEDRIGILLCQSLDRDISQSAELHEAMAQHAKKNSLELRSTWLSDFNTQAMPQARQLIAEGCSSLTIPFVPQEVVGHLPAFLKELDFPVSLPWSISALENFENKKAAATGIVSPKLTTSICRFFSLLGFDKIAFVGPDSPNNLVLQEKISTYTHFVVKEKREHQCGLVGKGSADIDELAKKWSAYKGHFAVLAYDDAMAMRFMTAMHKIGLSAPEDFVIIGHGNNEICKHTDPPLTSACPDYPDLAKHLLESARNHKIKASPRDNTPPKHQLILRASCSGNAQINDEIRAALPELEFIHEA